MRELRGILKNRRGIVGIEAAIVLIAFIIIAAALSYVVINMGFYTTQKTKETMQAGLEESLSALQLDGVVTGKTDNDSEIKYIVFPVKLSAGKESLDLSKNSTVVSVYLSGITLLNIYQGANSTTAPGLDSILNDTSAFAGIYNQTGAMFALYNDDEDKVLESNEKAFLIINLGNYTLADYQTIKIEVRTAKGAALTVVRTAPGGMPPSSYVDLG